MQERANLNGCWKGILPQCGVAPKFLTGKHVPCPMCGGKDRFRFDDKERRGTWFCTQCGAGDGYALVMRVKGVDFKDAADMARRVAGTPEPQRKPVDVARQMKERREMWLRGTQIGQGDPVGRWLHKRCGLVRSYPAGLKALRDRGSWVMLALMCDADGRGRQIHRTIFDLKGEFVGRKFMPGSLPRGGAVRLANPLYGNVLGVAEGIETAISASQLFGVPVWATLNAGNLKNWQPPDDIKSVIVFGDNDENGVGQAAAHHLAARICRGRDVSVEIPKRVGCDWNDVAAASGASTATGHDTHAHPTSTHQRGSCEPASAGAPG
jgi:putative DNA primase/helicase